MAIKAVCPECQTVYQLAEQQAGKKVRCKSCQTVFAVEEPSRQTAVRGENGPSSPTRAKPATMTARREDLKRDAFDEENGRGQAKREPARNVEKKSALPLILGTAVVGMGLLLLLSGVAITYLAMRDNQPPEVAKTTARPSPPMAPLPLPPVQPLNQPLVQPAPKADSQPVEGKPVQTVKPAPAPEKSANSPTDARASAERGKEEKETNNGRLTPERREHVRRATVYIRVKSPDGSGGSGSGFFGCKEAPNIVLTNAHVVGMLSPDSPRPLDVEVIVNSGEANEWSTKARVLGVDRASDLAVLDIGTPTQPLPQPLLVKAADGLNQLDEVYVFGFPLGEQLGKEITIRPASVSAMRKKSGVLDRVQVNGGMDPGNSGGPVVDNSGAVVGVAVSGIIGHQINFCIPGERVRAILSGRIAGLIVQQPYFTEDNKVAAPVVMGTIDPRNLLKEVGLELWTGDKPADAKSAIRPEAAKQPAAQAGDSPHVFYKMKYLAPEGKAPIVLPQLPPGKAYWGQARWVNAKGETHWEAAKPLPELPQPVYRKPAKLELRFFNGAKRSVDLTLENIFSVSDNDDADSVRVRTVAQLAEIVADTRKGGVTHLNLRYRFPPSKELILPGGKSYPSGSLEPIKDDFKNMMITTIQLNHLGTIIGQHIEPHPLMQLKQSNPQHYKAMMDFHEMVQQGLEALSVSMPASGTVNPLESWKAERHLPIDTPGKTESGKVGVAFTYQGTRKRDGREEAVISMDGLVRGKDDAVGGRASGQILVDVASGQTTLAETTMKLQLRAILSRPGEPPQELRVIATMKFKMVRKRLV